MVSITNEPESEDVTKKVTINKIAIMETKVVQGNCSSNTNNAVGISPSVAAEILPPSAPSSINRAEFPKMLSQRKVNPVGTNNTPRINSRIVRPLEILAMNMPTNGDHEIHQAQ